MLFRKRTPRSCQYCAYSAGLEDNRMLCAKRGLISACSGCRKFRYDPCKRIPPKPKALDFNKYNDEDFSL